MKTILYVEDDLANYHLIKRILETKESLTLVPAPEGSLVKALATAHQPSLILLDLNLSDMKGEDVLSQLKACNETRNIPVILVTGEVGTERVEKALGLGAAALLSKPFRVQEFLAMLDPYLSEDISG